MNTYIILTRFLDDAFDVHTDLNTYAQTVKDHIREECPDVTWRQSFMTMGSVDVVDVVEAEDPRDVQKAALIIRTFGYAHTETFLATPWNDFLDRLGE